MSSRVAVITTHEPYVAGMRGLAEDLDLQIVGPTTADGVGTITAEAIMALRPAMVVLGPGLKPEHRVTLTEQVDALHPDVIVIWGVDETPEAWRAATKAGARDILPPSSTREQAVTQLQRAIGIGDRRRSAGASRPVAELDIQPRGKIITVVSPKGGSGKTMLSSSLAVGLQERLDRDVVLVDLDLQFGDVAAALSLDPEYSVVDVVKNASDATDMKAFLAPHPSGMYTLPAPSNPIEAEDIDPDGVVKLLDTLSAEFGAVVVDTGAGIDEFTLTAIEHSTDLVFITTIDVAAIQAMRKSIVILDRLHLNQHRRWFVLNRANSRTGLSPREIEEVTGLAIDVEVPSSRAVSKAMNAGTAVIEDQSRTKLGKSLRRVAAMLEPAQPDEGRSS